MYLITHKVNLLLPAGILRSRQLCNISMKSDVRKFRSINSDYNHASYASDTADDNRRFIIYNEFVND